MHILLLLLLWFRLERATTKIKKKLQINKTNDVNFSCTTFCSCINMSWFSSGGIATFESLRQWEKKGKPIINDEKFVFGIWFSIQFTFWSVSMSLQHRRSCALRSTLSNRNEIMAKLYNAFELFERSLGWNHYYRYFIVFLRILWFPFSGQ